MIKLCLASFFLVSLCGIAAAGNERACQENATASCVIDLAENEMASMEQSPIADYRWGIRAFISSVTKERGHTYAAKLVEKYLTSIVYKDIGYAGIAESLYNARDLNTAQEYFSQTCLSSEERSKLLEHRLISGDFDSAKSLIGCTYGTARVQLISMMLNFESDDPGAHPNWLIQDLIDDVPTLVENRKPEVLCWTFAALNKYLVSPKPLEATIPLAIEIEDTQDREDALKGIIDCFTKHGEFRSALSAAENLGDASDRESEILRVSWAMAEAGDATGAQRIVEMIAKDDRDYFQKIWLIDLKLGYLKDAQTAIELSETDFGRPWPRSELALALEKSGDLTNAKKSAKVVVKTVLNDLSSEYPDVTSLNLVIMVRHLIEAEDIEPLRIPALQLVNAEKTTEYAYFARALCQFLAEIGEASEALDLALNNLTESERFICFSYILDARN